MRDWEQVVQNYITRHSDLIKKTTEPLKAHFGVNYFTYHRIDNAGHYTVLVDRPDWAEYYVSEKIFAQDPYLRAPSVYRSGICLVEQHGSKKYRETIMEHAKRFQMDVGVVLIQKKEDGVEFFGFAGNQATSSLRDVYLNHPYLLKSFARHFKKKTDKILIRMQEEKFSLLDMNGESYLRKDPVCPKIDLTSQFAYLQELGIGFEKLSKREIQCLEQLIKNRSAKQTADDLNLSRRTVEAYLENIKNKLGCIDKREIKALLEIYPS